MIENKKQTAVEWLVNEFNQKIDYIPVNKWDMIRDIIKQALTMEKEQIMDACNQTEFEEEDNFGIAENLTKGEQYYNETYGK